MTEAAGTDLGDARLVETRRLLGVSCLCMWRGMYCNKRKNDQNRCGSL